MHASNIPINKVEKITINNYSTQNQLITYGVPPMQPKDFYQKVGGYGGENFNPNNDSPAKVKTVNDLTKDNIYLRGGNTMAEALYKQNTDSTTHGSSIAMRMKKNKESMFSGSGPIQGINIHSNE